uniref:Uncharacterized protein n=1 Tax=Kalanchoe fedtschenkoi TaxID=63787 RepID=A0A7N0SZ93_KALFE
MDQEAERVTDFDMDSLKISLPQKRGLSRYYSGKARSFSSLADAQCLEDLKKIEPQAKRRKMYRHKPDREESGQIPSCPCK